METVTAFWQKASARWPEMLVEYGHPTRPPTDFQLPVGWQYVMWHLLDDIDARVRTLNASPGDDNWPCFVQIKEKFGRLRMYYISNDGPPIGDLI